VAQLGGQQLLPGFAVAVDREYAADETPLMPGGELALVPPVSGG
jgi:molybdopterin converting factor small subunit